MEIIAYTDGACSLKKRLGGAGVYIPCEDIHHCKHYEGSDVTNQRMELLACIEAVNLISKKVDLQKNNLIIYSDSMYTINSMKTWAKSWEINGWKRKVGKQFKDICNLDLIKTLYNLTVKYNINYKHVRSHQKEPEKDSDKWIHWNGNNIADNLAVKAKEE